MADIFSCRNKLNNWLERGVGGQKAITRLLKDYLRKIKVDLTFEKKPVIIAAKTRYVGRASERLNPIRHKSRARNFSFQLDNLELRLS